MSQKERVLDRLKEGSLTSKEALDELGVARLAAVVLLLKKDGHNITTESVSGKNRFGEPTNYGRYHLHGYSVKPRFQMDYAKASRGY